MRIKAWIGVAALSAAGVMVAVPAAAQFKKPDDAIKYRQAAFTVMGTHFARIGAVVKGAAPYDAKQVAHDAAVVETMSTLPFAAFGEGTDMGLKTRAKAEIWSDPAAFKAAAEKMQKAVVKLAEVAKSGDEAALKPAFGEVGKACKGCHDKFRAEE